MVKTEFDTFVEAVFCCAKTAALYTNKNQTT